MKKILITSTLLLQFLGLCLVSCHGSDTTYSFSYNGKNYQVVKIKKTWQDAALYATEKGGHLVEINDAGEQTAVYNAIVNGAKIDSFYTIVDDGGGIGYVWIGATDKHKEGTWYWDGNNTGKGQNFWNGEGAHGKGNGTAVNGAYVNWGGKSTGNSNEPDNYKGIQNVAAIGLADWPKGSGSLGHAGEWNDINENSQLYFVIEYDNK
jgi:hypothetical protein